MRREEAEGAARMIQRTHPDSRVYLYHDATRDDWIAIARTVNALGEDVTLTCFREVAGTYVLDVVGPPTHNRLPDGTSFAEVSYTLSHEFFAGDAKQVKP